MALSQKSSIEKEAGVEYIVNIVLAMALNTMGPNPQAHKIIKYGKYEIAQASKLIAKL